MNVPRMTSIVPSLRVTQIAAALPFYRALGFDVAFAFSGDEFTDRAVRSDATFARLDAEAEPPVSVFLERERGTAGGCIHLMVGAASNVDRIEERLRAAGYEPELGATDQPWGLRELHVHDADGNLVVVAGLSDAESGHPDDS